MKKTIQSHYIFYIAFVFIILFAGSTTNAQSKKVKSKKISPDLFGLFFEDINYAADGGLYAELIQNRSFEYSPTDRRDWNSFSFWDYTTPGYSYGSIDVSTSLPLNENNPHYIMLNIEHAGDTGIGIKNRGFNGIVIKKDEEYHLSLFAKQLSDNPIPLWIILQNEQGKTIAETKFSTTLKNWQKYSATLKATETCDSAGFILLATKEGKIALDVISLFPANTYKKRPNGMRADIAAKLAELKPAFIRFPGGCLAHGDGLGNMYRWVNTIGPVEQRLEQKNIWGYHQTMGLGYYEYFQFCEDIGAKPLPVLPAGVSCQNSGGTWRIGGTGQQAIPINEMDDYITEVLNLIEWANGPQTSEWVPNGQRQAILHRLTWNILG